LSEEFKFPIVTNQSRTIHRSGDEDFLSRLLEGICIAELISPSSEIWLFAAWITDFPLLDNSFGIANGIVADWPNQMIRLTQWLRTLAESGTRLYIETNTDEKNDVFERSIREMMLTFPPGRINFRRQAKLHTKGLIGDTFCLSGSFNFTKNGILILDEHGRYDVDVESVSRMRIEVRNRWNSRIEGEEAPVAS
jgi:hypothetical protein